MCKKCSFFVIVNKNDFKNQAQEKDIHMGAGSRWSWETLIVKNKSSKLLS
jgi:hypothetical protein